MFTCLLRSSNGNGLTKYALIGAWLVIGCIAGFLILSKGSLSGQLSKAPSIDIKQLETATLPQRQVSEQVPPQDSVSFQNAPIVSDGKTPDELLRDLTAQERIYLTRRLELKLQILGPSTTTKLIARQLSQGARQLLSEGKITNQQSLLLMQMAKQGFRIAQLEGLVENSIRRANGDGDKLKSLRFQYEQQSVNAYDLAGKIGFNVQSPQDYAQSDILTDNNHAQPEMANFLNLYSQAQSSGLFTIPELKATITSAAIQIASTGEAIETLLNLENTDKSKGKIPRGSELNDAIANSAAPINVSKVCTFNNFAANGILCHKG